MKVKEFLAHLGNLPKEVQEQEIILIVDGNTHLTSDVFGCAAEPIYWNCDYGLVDETTAKRHIREVEPEFNLSMNDFELAYPTHSVFISAAKVPASEPSLSDKMNEVVALYDEDATDFAQGGIPHLRVERE